MHPMKSYNLFTPVLFALLLTLIPTLAVAQAFKVLYTFQGPPADGELPTGLLVLDRAGNIYGTTGGGGTGKYDDSGTCGTAFMLSSAGKEMAHISFQLSNACDPIAGPLRDAEGNFFGTTFLGGDSSCYEYGCGSVYKVSKTGKETVLHNFTGTPGATGQNRRPRPHG